MQKLKNNTLQKFLDYFIEELKNENEDREYREEVELDIPFIVSTLYQSLKDEEYKYKEFISDLERWFDYNLAVERTTNDYNGIIDVSINLVKFGDYKNYKTPDYDYKICFEFDDREYGFCNCTPDMEDYREDKKCCGHGCDATFCKFKLCKITDITKDTWNGDEHDYWDFEDEFYMSDKELADKKNKKEKQRKIKELKETIAAIEKELAELESDTY